MQRYCWGLTNRLTRRTTIKTTLSEQAFKWHDGQQWHVGKMVMEGDLPVQKVDDGFIDAVLVAHSHTRDLEFIDPDDLSPYGPPGGDKMPEAGK